MKLTKSMGSKVALSVLALVVLFALVITGLNRSSLPDRLGGLITGALQRSTGWEIDVADIEFVSPTRLVMRDVSFQVPGEVKGSDWIKSGSASSIQVSVNPLRLLFGDSQSVPLGRMVWIDPEIYLTRPLLAGVAGKEQPSPSTGAALESGAETPKGAAPIDVTLVDARIFEPQGIEGPGGGAAFAFSATPKEWRLEGDFRIESRGGRPITIKAMELVEPDVNVRARVDFDEKEEAWEWAVSGPADVLSGALTHMGWSLNGALSASGRVTLAEESASPFELTVAQGDFRWGENASDEQIAFRRLSMEGELGSEIAVSDLMVELENGSLRAFGEIVPNFDQWTATELKLDVYSNGLGLSESIPIMERFGLAGQADFSGVLAGTLGAPELSGRLKIADGTVWHRPVDKGEGVIRLSSERFTFGQVSLERAASRYQLSGAWQFGAGETTFNIELTSRNGSAVEILTAAGLRDSVELAGTVDGSFVFSSRPDGVHASGTITKASLIAWGQPLDSVTGEFAWDPEGLRLTNARLRHGRGTAFVNGQVSHGQLGFDLSLDQWSLDLTRFLPGSHLAHQFGGWINYQGRLEGPVASPRLAGQLKGGDLAIGQWGLHNPTGNVTLSRERVTLDNVAVRSIGEGTYRLAGDIAEWMSSKGPELDLEIQVTDASLSALLSETGLTLPALLLDGDVDGTIGLSGSASRPDARFDLALSDELSAGDPMRLRFNLEEGRIKLGAIPGLDFLLRGARSGNS